MVDSVIAGTGDSRYLRTSIPAGTTWEDALTMLRAGTFPIDLAGINQGGFTTLGTALNAENLLKAAIITALNLSASATPSDAWEAVLTLIAGKADTSAIPSAAADVGAVAVAQGVGHAGEFLVVGNDGNVTTVTLSTWQGGSY